MPLFAFVGLSVSLILAATAWSLHSLSHKPRYHACGYRMIRPARSPAIVVTNGFGVGLFGGVGILMLGLAVLG